MNNYDFDNENCPLKQKAKEKTKNFYIYNRNIPEIKLIDLNDEMITCKKCGKQRFKLYTKFGGTTYDKKGKVLNSVLTRYNFACSCGIMLVLNEGTFKYAKIKYGCSASKCPENKTKMDKSCLTCKFIYEK